jgi:hypothetical protein
MKRDREEITGGGRHRGVLLACVCLIFALAMTFALLAPASLPSPISGFDLWIRAHWTLFIWIIVALVIVDFVRTFERFQESARKKFSSIDKDVRELKAELDELNRRN